MDNGVVNIPSTSQLPLANTVHESEDDLEAWWVNFVKQKQDDELRSTCSDWRKNKQFVREVKQILEFYGPLEKLAHSILDSTPSHRGETLFREWGLVRRKECLLAYYDNETFRAVYTLRKYVNCAVLFLQALVHRIIPENEGLDVYLRDHVTRIISIGAGPGPDLAAYLTYTRTQGFKQRLVYYAMDQCCGWNPYLFAFDRHWSADYKVSVWFKNFRFGKCEDIDTLPDADMLVFSFSNTALMANAIWPKLRERFPLIIVLDGMKEVIVDGFSSAGFKSFSLTERTRVYYHFAPPS